MPVLLEIHSITTPLAADSNGVIKIAGSRVTLDTVIGAFIRGATAEEIAQQYPSVSLADVYATISYYLHIATKWKNILKNAGSTPRL